MNKKELVEKISLSVKEGDSDEAASLAKTGLEAGYEPLDILAGVTSSLKEIGESFGREEMFLTELMFCAEAGKTAMAVLNEAIIKQKKEVPYIGKVVIGTVAGDIHDIGKSLVSALLAAEGFDVTDLGVDVPDEVFIENVKKLKPDVLGMSALVTYTMYKFTDVIEKLEKAGLRKKVKVIVGGAFVDQDWADEVGADAVGTDAVDAINKIKALIKNE